ncbi:MAG: beta(1,3)galactosyltransferase EpsH [Clostridiales bacterium]|nr:beta(1,3)galactosyltransferase EpsH [Clostridiales bacterium]
MIFVTVGSQKFQFDRLLKAVDQLVADKTIDEAVFAQIGYSSYQPLHYPFQAFLSREEFAAAESKADIIITHGGTGAIIGAVKKGKRVIAVPRLARYGEHVDDHQLQLIEQFSESNLISSVEHCEDLHAFRQVLQETKTKNYAAYQSNTREYLDSISTFIEAAKR